jgi:hypothetical protein
MQFGMVGRYNDISDCKASHSVFIVTAVRTSVTHVQIFIYNLPTIHRSVSASSDNIDGNLFSIHNNGISGTHSYTQSTELGIRIARVHG